MRREKSVTLRIPGPVEIFLDKYGERHQDLAMCDTFIKNCGGDAAVFFGKNSDRHPEEPQTLFYGEADLAKWEKEISDVPPDYADGPLVLLRQAFSRFSHPYRALVSRPSWMWGAEMGINERGVAVGNEAVFSRKHSGKSRQSGRTGGKRSDGLLGMDILRLALHNGRDAHETVNIITSLIDREGQGGNEAYRGRLFYDNSFLVSDGRQAFVVETADRRWAVRTVTSDSISNIYTIGVDFQSCDAATSEDASLHTAPESRMKGSYSFADAHASALYPPFTRGGTRRARSRELLDTGHFTLSDAFGLLRDHGVSVSPRRGMGHLCMHSGPFIKSETTASMAVEWKNGIPVVWITGTPNPCVSLFQPWVFPDTGQDAAGLSADLNAGPGSGVNTSPDAGPDSGSKAVSNSGSKVGQGRKGGKDESHHAWSAPVFTDYSGGNELFYRRRETVRSLVKNFRKISGKLLVERDRIEEELIRWADEFIAGGLTGSELDEFCRTETERYFGEAEKFSGMK